MVWLVDEPYTHTYLIEKKTNESSLWIYDSMFHTFDICHRLFDQAENVLIDM